MTPADAYNACTRPPPLARGTYVALSGNTSAGKSSLIAVLEAAVTERGLPCVGISERAFHHPYLKLMFSEPERFAFPIQLSFMLERHLLLMRNLQLGRVVIIERSHLDDRIFADAHFERRNLTRDQHNAYKHLSEVLHDRLPLPDVLVLMNPAPEVSIARLAAAETSGERPREFPSDEVRDAWVRRWHRHYTELHDQYRRRALNDEAFADVTLIEADATADRQDIAARVLRTIEAKACVPTR